MKKSLLPVLIILLFISCKTQKTNVVKPKLKTQTTIKKQEVVKNDKVAYTKFVNEAWKLYETKEYTKSAQKYKEAFEQLGGKAIPSDRYNASCSYALSENKETAFYHLFKLAKDAKYSNLGHITTDSDLDFIHDDARWKELITLVKTNKEIEEKDLDKPLVAKLEKIFTEDQKYRRQINEISEKFGWKSDEMKAHWKIIQNKDSLNLIEIKKILDERGWLGKSIIGRQGNSTLFLVIQHADIKTQLKYLPMMRDAVKKGDANPSGLALLEDRVALRQGKRQIYGSQIHSDKETGEKYVAPLIDPENVDKRRAEVGLPPIANYIGHWNLTWDVKKHIERTAKIEAKKSKK